MYQVMGIGNIVIGKMSIEKTVVGNKSRRQFNVRKTTKYTNTT